MKRKKRVLAIDDEPAIIEWLQVLLEHAGYEVKTALIGNRGGGHIRHEAVWAGEGARPRPVARKNHARPAGVSVVTNALAGQSIEAVRWRVRVWSAPHQPRGGPPGEQPWSP